jgi:hypothetical protein
MEDGDFEIALPNENGDWEDDYYPEPDEAQEWHDFDPDC